MNKAMNQKIEDNVLIWLNPFTWLIIRKLLKKNHKIKVNKEKIKREIISLGTTAIIALPIAGIVYLEVIGKSILPELPSSWGGKLVEGLTFGIPYWLVIFSMIVVYIAFIHLVFAIPNLLKKSLQGK